MTVPYIPYRETPPLDAASRHMKAVSAGFLGMLLFAWFIGSHIPWLPLLIAWFVPTFAYLFAAAIGDSIREILKLLKWAPWR